MKLKNLLKGRTSRKKSMSKMLNAQQWELGQVPPLNLCAIVETYLAAHSGFSFIQIGAHDRSTGDPISQLIVRRKLPGVMVEPQKAEFEKLKSAFGEHDHLRLERAAISHNSGVVQLYKVNEDFWLRHGLPKDVMTQISSLDPGLIRAHVEMFGGADLAKNESVYLEAETVPSITLADLVQKHDCAHYDLLQIDTEGFDYEVIKMVDWEAPPRLIHFETVHLSQDDRVEAWNFLRQRGYSLYATNVYNTLAISSDFPD